MVSERPSQSGYDEGAELDEPRTPSWLVLLGGLLLLAGVILWLVLRTPTVDVSEPVGTEQRDAPVPPAAPAPN